MPFCASGQVSVMNALPIKNRRQPGEVIDDLIDDYGFRRVVLAIAARIIKRSRPPDGLIRSDTIDAPRINVISDHIRRDLGLPPEGPPRAHVDLSIWARRDLF
jgi:hypothetical protein